MIHLNVGDIMTHEFLDEVIKLNEQSLMENRQIIVSSMYGSLGGLTPTARSEDRLPHRSLEWYGNYVKKMLAHNIQPRYALNASCLGHYEQATNDWNKFYLSICEQLHEFGVNQFTVTSPYVLMLLKQKFPESIVEVSTIAEVKTMNEWRRWGHIGADFVCLSTSINRDFKALREFNTYADRISLIANEACLYNCPFRRDCYNMSSHDSTTTLRGSLECSAYPRYPFIQCQEIRDKNPVEWIKSRMILPQWMTHYNTYLNINHFKITFRTHAAHVALPILKAYMDKDFVGNLTDLWPTISNLGGEIGVNESVYIDTYKLEKSITWFMDNQCSEHECGIGCRYCENILSRGKK